MSWLIIPEDGGDREREAVQILEDSGAEVTPPRPGRSHFSVADWTLRMSGDGSSDVEGFVTKDGAVAVDDSTADALVAFCERFVRNMSTSDWSFSHQSDSEGMPMAGQGFLDELAVVLG